MNRQDFLIPDTILLTLQTCQPFDIFGAVFVLFVYVALNGPCHPEAYLSEVKYFINGEVVWYVCLIDVWVISMNQVIKLDACVYENKREYQRRDNSTYDRIHFRLAIDVECRDLFAETV